MQSVLVAAGACVLGGMAGLAAQGETADPYTRHDPAAIRAAGIVALQRFTWADDHTTSDIQSLMGHEPFRFVETEHFKLAVSLAPASTRGTDATALRAELGALRGRLPAIDPNAAVIDGWTRAHLYAARLERLYADFARRFGVTASAGKARRGSAFAADYAGEGPYLGQEDKFAVLLCRDAASVNAYLANFLDAPAVRQPVRMAVGSRRSLLLAVAETMADADLRDDDVLHATVVYHAAHLLLDGYRHYWHDCPPWFEEGVAHWFRVAAVPDVACFGHRPFALPTRPAAKSWLAKTKVRVARRSVVSSADLFALADTRVMTFDEHLAAWSRVDFLMRAHAEAFPLVARAIKGPDASRTPPRPAPLTVQERSAQAVRAVFGWTPADFDHAWAAWVASTATADPLPPAASRTPTRKP